MEEKNYLLRKLAFFVILLHFGFNCFSQPVINSITPVNATIGSTVTISGTNFNPSASGNSVYFGAAKAIITTATSSSLTVMVPTGATHGRVALVTGNFTAYAPVLFNVISGVPLTANSFTTKNDFAAGVSPDIIARGDLDNDGKPDMAVSNFSGSTISVYKNISIPGTVSFSGAITFTTKTNPEAISFEDINSDGKQDIIVTSINDHLFSVFINNGTNGNISFIPRQDFLMANADWPRGIVAADMDGDGLNDIVTANNNKLFLSNGDSYGTIAVNRNISVSPVSLNFAQPVYYSAGEYARSIFATDLDGDKKPDVAVTNNGTNNISIFLNKSTPGNISLTQQQTLLIAGRGEQITLGDIDMDGKTDLVATQFTGGGTIKVFRNTSTLGVISFDQGTSVSCDYPLGVSIGDIDGDGKPDVAVANFFPGSVSVFKNTSTTGSISFAPKKDYGAGTSFVDVKIGDVDGDNFPDLTVSEPATSKVAVLRMTEAALPVIVNLGNDTTICERDSVTLKTNIASAQYLWSTGATANEIVVKQSGKYWVKVTTPTLIASDTINIQVNPYPVVSIGNDTVMCNGNLLVLNGFNVGATYKWNTGSSNPSITINNAGKYNLAVDLNGCVARDTIAVTYNSIPVFSLGPDAILCSNETILLKPEITNADFLWQDGSKLPEFKVSQPGIYKVIASNSCGSYNDDIKIEGGNCGVFIPSAFTPDNNGINDILKPLVYGHLVALKFQIYDRWGNLIFFTSEQGKGWNGKIKGVKANAAVFIWQCTYQFAGKQPVYQKGSFVLIR